MHNYTNTYEVFDTDRFKYVGEKILYFEGEEIPDRIEKKSGEEHGTQQRIKDYRPP